MKLTIDTQQDTIDDIRKVVHILSEIIQRKGGSSSVVENMPAASSVDTASMMNMFDTPAPSRASEGTPIDFTSFTDLINKKKETESKGPQVQTYDW